MLSNNRPKFIIKDFSILFTMVLPLTIVKIPGPFQHKHPQIIRLTLANRPGLMHCGTHSTPGLRHTRLFSPMNTLHSSGYITQLQSRSTFQCLFSLAHATRFFMLTSQIRMFFSYNTSMIFITEQTYFHGSFRNRIFPKEVKSVDFFQRLDLVCFY